MGGSVERETAGEDVASGADTIVDPVIEDSVVDLDGSVADDSAVRGDVIVGDSVI